MLNSVEADREQVITARKWRRGRMKEVLERLRVENAAAIAAISRWWIMKSVLRKLMLKIKFCIYLYISVYR